jgi:hypothetical protein
VIPGLYVVFQGLRERAHAFVGRKAAAPDPGSGH